MRLFPETRPHPVFDTEESRVEMLGRMEAADREVGPGLLNAPGVVKETEDTHGLERQWLRSAEIKPAERLARTHGPLIEMAGPSHHEYHLVDTRRLPRRLITTNIDPATPGDYDSLHFVDIQADGRDMPLRDGEAGAVLARYFGGVYTNDMTEPSTEEIVEGVRRIVADRGRAIEEAWRLTEPGGLLIWESGHRIDLAYAISLGYRPLMIEQRVPREHTSVWEAVAQHPESYYTGEEWSGVLEKPAAAPEPTADQA